MALIIAIALPMALPVFHLPTPTGPYAVGTTTLELVDPSRPEMYPPHTQAHRDLLVQVWYPAERVSGAKPQPYLPDAFGSFLATSLNRPGFVLNYQNVIQTHSSQDVPVAHARPMYPVLFFSPGDAGIVQQYTVQMEELSSHGYVVFGINHPYTAAVVVYPDGRTVSRNPPQVSSPEALQSWIENSLKVWTQDTRFVLDELERLNRGERPSLFAGRLDLNRIGIFGHSFGGTTAGEVCVLDSRCKASVDLDGLPRGDLPNRPLKQPFMIMYSTDFVGTSDVVYHQAYRVFIRGARHENFSDLSLQFGLSIGSITGFVGSIDGQRMETILDRYLVAFFDKHLMDIASPLLDGPDPRYPEVAFQRR